MAYIDRALAVSPADAMELIEKIIDAVKNNQGITWAIAFKDASALIGTIGFWTIDKENHRAEICYTLNPQQHRQGIMQEAIVAVLEYGFQTMRLHSVEANVNPANEASQKLLAKHRFVQEAFFKENYYFNGKFLDSAIYSLLTPLRNLQLDN